MNDGRDDDFSRLERQLAALPQETPPGADTWKRIEHAIADAPLDARLQKIAQAVQPAENLWPRIATKIHDSRRPLRSRWQHRNAAAALLAASLAIVAIGGLFLRGDRVPMDGSSVTPVPERVAGSSYEPASGSEADPSADLLFSSSPRPELREAQSVYETHIALVREERKAIEASLVEYPNDLSLRALWRHAYETELLLIDAAGRTLSTI